MKADTSKDIESEKEIQEEQMQSEGANTAKSDITEVEELKNQLSLLNDKYLRLSAEFDNYRKRTLKEKAEILKSAGENIFLGLLPVLDNFERALESMQKSDDVDSLREGVELIYSGFKGFLAQNGVQEIECLHKEFDLDEHEAVTQIPAPEVGMKGKVLDCIQKGYKLNEKVIRFPKVVVGE